MAKKLSYRQEAELREVRDQSWRSTTWSTNPTMGALERRGLIEADYSVNAGTYRTHWRLTDAGRAHYAPQPLE